MAKFVIAAIESGEFGIFHASCKGTRGRLEFARTILGLAGLNPECATSAYNPDSSYHLELDNPMLKMTGVFEMPHWREDLQTFMADHELLG